MSDPDGTVGTGDTGDGWSGGGRAALTAWAPEVAPLLDDLGRLRAEAVDESVMADPRVVAFAEQFAMDVTGVDDELRRGLGDVAGREVFAVVQLVYVADFWPRVRSALDALFGPGDWPVDEPRAAADIWSPLDGFMRAVAQLTALDATTTELVRLRGARQHVCRVCSSRRSVAALDAGADESTFDAVDHHADSDLPAEAKAALALTDALIWTPRDIPSVVVADVHAHLTPAQAVEVVLDVARNAANKIAVALAADAAEVTDGVQLFSTDADGVLTTIPA